MINEHDIADMIEINGMFINPKQIATVDPKSRRVVFSSGFIMEFTTPDFEKLMNFLMPKKTTPPAVKKAKK
jgi:hypothetical protein